MGNPVEGPGGGSDGIGEWAETRSGCVCAGGGWGDEIKKRSRLMILLRLYSEKVRICKKDRCLRLPPRSPIHHIRPGCWRNNIWLLRMGLMRHRCYSWRCSQECRRLRKS